MSRPRLLIPGPWEKGQILAIRGKDAKRLTRVLRMGKGDILAIFDGQGMEGTAKILDQKNWSAVKLEVIQVHKASVESPIKIHLAQGLAKWPKMEILVQKVTELGVEEVSILLSRRSISRPDGVDKIKKLAKIMEEASRQCGRANVPRLSGPWNLEEFLDHQRKMVGAKFLLWEGERSNCLKEVLEAWKIPPEEVWVVVGPEGGFEENEVEMMVREGFVPVSIGPRILRTETASLAAVAVVQYLWGDMGSSIPSIP